MYQSLLKHCENFQLFIFAFDDATYQFFSAKKYPKVTVISLSDFEDSELLRIKPTRSAGEYCWTCTASTILYAIEKFNLDNCTYVDADMQFYLNPISIWNEAKSKSVIITSHNYTTKYDQSKESGIYCVQFVGFRNDANGMKVLKWWRNACIDWCYARIEDSKFGDQKYLDDWTTRFEGVHVVENPGAGVAPWNCQQYSFKNVNNDLTGIENSTEKKFDVVFFHFHGLVFYSNSSVMLTGQIYKIKTDVLNLFYKPYVSAIQKTKSEITFEFFKGDADGNRPALKDNPGFSYAFYLRIKTLKSLVKNMLKGKFQFTNYFNHYYYKDSFTKSN